ncbi:phosphoadenylyl-sulfate reductase [Litoreibacter albidus]|uniref:Adenosine 5'-phosphosulfate reductase n=1 Tax=Litoreibacter albidus TaxID=670155 RepID=A0A1H2XPK1_9RHOB|nr:phosphoadenylyl-sulfate reductase [Litoreibacter albidus]SDW94831.1 phosphoadenylylsulfate reductase (thioredoxin) [Litoreibacter albidus]
MPLKELAERRAILHRKSDPQTIVKHALDDVQLGKVAMVSSFGAESVVLLHMISQTAPDTPILFIDTEMLFPETLQYQKDVAEELGLTNVQVVKPSREKLLEQDVDGILHTIDPDACCALRKTQPLEDALEGYDAWITGRKRYQSGSRAELPVYEKSGRKIKINPLADWNAAKLVAYIEEHNLPKHPLVARGFQSLGCAPCTTKTKPGEDPRAGRWRGQDKSECGIHIVDGKVVRQRNAA